MAVGHVTQQGYKGHSGESEVCVEDCRVASSMKSTVSVTMDTRVRKRHLATALRGLGW